MSATINALLELINSSAKEAVAEYEKSPAGVPTLDAPHAFDEEYNHVALKRAVRVLEAATEQLTTILSPPAHTLINRGQGSYDPACLRVAVSGKIADLLSESPNGLTVSQISEKTGIESGKLARVLRHLATRNIFKAISTDTYINNRLSTMLVSTNIISAAVGHHTDECKLGASYLYEGLSDPEWSASYDPKKAAYMYAHKHKNLEGNAFDVLMADKLVAARFGKAMMGWGKLTASEMVVTEYPWDTLPKGTKFCDVGGGTGGLSLALAKAHPNLLITLQDQPKTIEEAKGIWAKDYPAAIEEKRVTFAPFDLFNEPPAAGQNIYYIRHVVHGMSDDQSVELLNKIKSVMAPGAHVLIHELALRSLVRSSTSAVAQAPEPLLPNYGSGNIRMYNQDLNMLAMANAKERTVEDFINIGERAGFRTVKAWDFLETSAIELAL